MSKDLALYKNFFHDIPSLFDWDEKSRLTNFPEDISKAISGKCDFEELEDKYIVELEVPGVKKDEIDMTLKNDNLTISWTRKRESKGGLLNKKRYERSCGSFTRSFYVDGVDINKVEADLSNGVLKISLPKLDSVKAKKIEIK